VEEGKMAKTISILESMNTNMRNEVTGHASVLPEDVVWSKTNASSLSGRS
jgi:hypothetical protein